MITVDQARARIVAAAPKPRIESVKLWDATGRVLARDLAASVTQPPSDASAMDGYAVRRVDVEAVGAQLRVIGEAPAGAAYDGVVNAGQAVRIFTGGVVPAGADHIVIQEHVERARDTIALTAAQGASSHIRAAGADFRAGDVVLPAGAVLAGDRMALAAAANVAALDVARRPFVAVLSSGDELVEPGGAPNTAQIVNSTAYGLGALIERWGGAANFLGIADDTIASVHAKLENAAGADVIVPLGGASVGDHDVMKDAFGERGFEAAFEKVAVKPGKPTWFGAMGEACVLGLPGNPASALVCAHLFLKPLLYAATGRHAANAFTLQTGRLGEPLNANGARENFLRGRAALNGEGVLEATAFPRQDSSLLTPFATANCLVRRAPTAPAAGAGERVEVLLLDGFG